MKRPTVKKDDTYLTKMVKYIPTEIVAAYVTVSGFIKGLPPPQQYRWFCIAAVSLLVFPPWYLRIATATAGHAKSMAHPLTGALAFAAWVFATGGPFEHYQIQPDGSGWYTRAIGSIVLVLVCLAFPVVERVLPQKNT
jgi:hypothetical protein